MSEQPTMRETIQQWAQGAGALNVAYVGVASGLLDAIDAATDVSLAGLVASTGLDAGYVNRWLDAAYAFELLDEVDGQLALSEAGRLFTRSTPQSMWAMPVNLMLGAHMAERAATLMRTGERPGERVLAERESILPLFGPMLEATFGPMFEAQILPALPIFRELSEKGGLAVDLGCGNGWYLRKLAAAFPGVRGVGMDGFDENIRQATELAAVAGLSERLSFRAGDLHDFTVAEPVDLIAMNRALHHVWDEKEQVFAQFKRHLKVGGVAVMWEPAWPADPRTLRNPASRGLAVQNLGEHIQGNHLLRPDEIVAAFEAVGMSAEVHLFLGGKEAIVVGRKC